MLFNDLTNQQLKGIIRNYNNHLKIPLKGLKRDDLLKIAHKHFDIDNEKIKLKNIEPIYFDVPEKKIYKRKKKTTEKKIYKRKVKTTENEEIKHEMTNDLIDDLYNEPSKPNLDATSRKYNFLDEPSRPNKNEKNEIYEANDKLHEVVDRIIKIKNPYTFHKNREKLNNELNSIIVSLGHKPIMEDMSKNILEAYSYGFYPTPQKCISYFKDIIERAENILEPTVGLGHILNYIRKVNPSAKLTAIEYNPFFVEILKALNPDTTINPDNTNDFLYYFPEKNNFDLIVINPPFTHGHDKQYYMDFLFHSLYILNKSKYKYEKQLIFISPSITKAKKTQYIELHDIINNCSKNKLLEILKRYNIKPKPNELNYIYEFDTDNKIVQDIEDLFNFSQATLDHKCKEFLSTNIEADMYSIVI